MDEPIKFPADNSHSLPQAWSRWSWENPHRKDGILGRELPRSSRSILPPNLSSVRNVGWIIRNFLPVWESDFMRNFWDFKHQNYWGSSAYSHKIWDEAGGKGSAQVPESTNSWEIPFCRRLQEYFYPHSKHIPNVLGNMTSKMGFLRKTPTVSGALP